MISAEVSLYPQKTTNASKIINDSLDAINQRNLKVNVGSISSYLQGSEEEVWAGLKKMFDEAKKQSEVNMVVTLSNSAD